MHVPDGVQPRAVRILRGEASPVIVRLSTQSEYQVGRTETSHFYFEDTNVSRMHGLLYFSESARVWAFKETGAVNGTFLVPTIGNRRIPKEQRLVPGLPTSIVAGQTMYLGGLESRIEFLADIPSEEAGSTPGWRSAAGRALEKSTRVAARHTLPVFLLGESGSGKTYAAGRIHALAGLKGHLVEVNCGSLPDRANELASFFLGHIRGAFTGASEAREGRLFQAHNGTLFLDEVESLPAEAQVFLLDVLEGKGDLVPLGASLVKRRPRPSFRLISASKARLEESKLRNDWRSVWHLVTSFTSQGWPSARRISLNWSPTSSKPSRPRGN